MYSWMVATSQDLQETQRTRLRREPSQMTLKQQHYFPGGSLVTARHLGAWELHLLLQAAPVSEGDLQTNAT